jgi:hypothetical protein
MSSNAQLYGHLSAESHDEPHPGLSSVGASASALWPTIDDNYTDTGAEQDDEECVDIERRSGSLLIIEACKTPEQQHAINEQRTSTLTAASRSIKTPPLLRPKHPSLAHSHQPWNVPTDQEYDELTSRLNVQDAPRLPQSPESESPLQRRPHFPSHNFWKRNAIPATNSSISPLLEAGCRHDESVNSLTSQKQHPSKRSASLPRRMTLTFKECHFVRLPPRVSKSDGYLHDITWRVHHLDTCDSLSNSEISSGIFKSPDRKRNKINFCTANSGVPLLTPVEGYTVATLPIATLFSHDDSTPQTENQSKRSSDRLTFYRDKYYCRNVDEVVSESALKNLSSKQEESSREATPLPLLDLDDDSASMSSWNEGSTRSSNDGRCDRCSDSPNSDAETIFDPSTAPPSVIGWAKTSASTNISQRTIPLKPPKLKMRTNHPLLVQHSNFCPFVQLSPKQQHE